MDHLLGERVPRQVTHAKEEVVKLLKELASGLHISSLDVKIVEDGWVRVFFLGEDQEAYETILDSTFGYAKPSLYEIHRGDTLKGFVSERDSSGEGLRLDVGVVDPKRILASLPVTALQAQLCDGRLVNAATITDAFCLSEDVPVQLRVGRADDHSIECWLSDKAVERLEEWRNLPLDRLVIVGASHAMVSKAIDFAKLNRDVAKVDSISAFVQVVAAKIGTQARGLIRPLGVRLGTARIHVFEPKKARKLRAGT